ncbi:hypothetical protein [Bifidobacterium oedipodis]|uniref:Uncharacterized protein n=1 Tax=Bifidobacterium oedipodis TaxID=2675322 RepID=A0A7Y0EP91_9BIFI|nr:hypothetical protein [Bifidobacterium sp. DSM 109957]NMM93906.1 hypothetical protein [Bifidobacterium sp. DSM 109957]
MNISTPVKHPWQPARYDHVESTEAWFWRGLYEQAHKSHVEWRREANDLMRRLQEEVDHNTRLVRALADQEEQPFNTAPVELTIGKAVTINGSDISNIVSCEEGISVECMQADYAIARIPVVCGKVTVE